MLRTLDPDAIPLHFPRLYRAARALTGSWVDADDLVQETCARLLAKPRCIRGDDELGYLLTALRNTYISRFHGVARRPEVVGLPDGIEPSATDALDARVRSGEIFGWIAELPESLAAPLVAVDVAGLSLAETASTLQLRERDVRVQLARARVVIGARLRPAA